MTNLRQQIAHHLANMFQIGAHAGQKRKFSGLPYHTHPQAVLKILTDHVPDASEAMRLATLLHDTVEDTGVTLTLIHEQFGTEVAEIVDGLTNRKHKYPNGVPKLNRAAQKQLDAHRMASQPWKVKVIKLCDRLHNLPDIIENDPKHARVYVPETRHLLDTALTGVHDVLWNKLDAICKEYDNK